MQPIPLIPFDAKTNVNVARNQYDPQGNPWFGKSLNSVDFPNWGHPHQVHSPCFCNVVHRSLCTLSMYCTAQCTHHVFVTKQRAQSHLSAAVPVGSFGLCNSTCLDAYNEQHALGALMLAVFCGTSQGTHFIWSSTKYA